MLLNLGCLSLFFEAVVEAINAKLEEKRQAKLKAKEARAKECLRVQLSKSDHNMCALWPQNY